MSIADTAAKLLAKNGEAVTITASGTPAFNPITGAVATPVAGQSIVANGYASKYMSKDIDGTVINAHDIRLILELITTRPEVGSKALVNGLTYRIMDVQTIRKAALDVVYICQLRAN